MVFKDVLGWREVLSLFEGVNEDVLGNAKTATKKAAVYFYFCLKKICTGTPLKLKCSLNLFSRKRLYGSLMYCGRLQKNANEGLALGSWVMYLILMYLPFHAGGG